MKRVRIGEKEYPVVFGLLALQLVSEHFGVDKLQDLDQILAGLSVSHIPVFVEACVKNGCVVENIEPPTSEEVKMALNRDLGLMFAIIQIMNLSQNDDGSFDARPELVEEKEEGPGN